MIATVLDYENAIRYIEQGQWKEDWDIALADGLVNNDKMTAGDALRWFPHLNPVRHNLGVYFIQYVLHISHVTSTPVLMPDYRHVVNNVLAIDLNILLPFIEEVTSQLVYNHYEHYASANFDGLTLPRSWIVRVLFRAASERPNGGMPYVLLAVLETLLEILLDHKDSGSERLEGEALWNLIERYTFQVFSPLKAEVCQREFRTEFEGAVLQGSAGSSCYVSQ